MAAQLLLINPRKRARRANPRRRLRARSRTRARRRNPVSTVVHRRVMANPRRRRSYSARRRHNPIRRSYRRNPGMGSFSTLAGSMLKEAALGGVGSVIVNTVMGYIKPSLPATVQTGYTYSAVKALATIAFGMLARKSMGASGVAMAQGALTVQMAVLIQSQVGSSLPGDGSVAGLGYYTAGSQVRGGGGNTMLPRLGRARSLGMYTGSGNLAGGVGMGTVSEMQGSVFR